MSCLNCGSPRYQGPRAGHADEFVCRECQKSPAIQMRILLQGARARGMDFDRAWGWAFERIRWPHDTDKRLEWKATLGDEDAALRVRKLRSDAREQVEIWRRAFAQQGVQSAHLTELVELVA